ncbi:MAG: hypothetical protein U7127_01410 [Phormidium sp.]
MIARKRKTTKSKIDDRQKCVCPESLEQKAVRNYWILDFRT